MVAIKDIGSCESSQCADTPTKRQFTHEDYRYNRENKYGASFLVGFLGQPGCLLDGVLCLSCGLRDAVS